MLRTTFAGLWIVVASIFALGAAAQEDKPLPIDAFKGEWRGNAISESEVSVYFQVTARDVIVRVTPQGEDRFDLMWATVLRQEGDPNNPTEELKDTTISFEKRGNVWWGVDSGDPAKGEQLQWAKIEGNTLVVSLFTVTERGDSELQTYRRSLSDMGMTLSYSRIQDGKLVRTAKGRLVKHN